MAQICQDADLLLATSIRSHGLALHYVTDLPWVTISLNAVTFTSPVASSEKQTKGDARLLEFQAYQPMIDYVCEQFGVNKSLPPWRPGWSFARHILLASSPYFSHVELSQLQPHSSIDQTGFWFYEDPAWTDWLPSAELSAFCERRPLALAFSSQPVQDTRRLLELHVAAAKLVGLPLLIQRGWADFNESDLPPDFDPAQVMFADYLPHDWLFARCSAAIQHGGIGSIARALRQACPLLIEPFGNDQLFNARQVASLGAGAFTPPFETTPESLARLLEESVLTEDARQRAAWIGAAISAERGLEDACEMIDRYLSRLTPAGAHPQIYDKFTPPLTPRSKQASLPQPERVFNLLLLQGKETSRLPPLTEAGMARLLEQPAPLPQFSCLMVTNDRFSLARRGCRLLPAPGLPA